MGGGTDVINNILNNRTASEEIDEFDMSLICGALHCDADYFIDSEVRGKDLLIATMGKETDTVKSENVKAKNPGFHERLCKLSEKTHCDESCSG